MTPIAPFEMKCTFVTDIINLANNHKCREGRKETVEYLAVVGFCYVRELVR